MPLFFSGVMMDKWEYRVVVERPQDGAYGSNWLSKYGAEGWELVAVGWEYRQEDQRAKEYTFKRRIP